MTGTEQLTILANVQGYLVQQQCKLTFYFCGWYLLPISYANKLLDHLLDQFAIDDVDETSKMADYLTSNNTLNTMHSMSNVFL